MNRILTFTGLFIGMFSLLIGCNLKPDNDIRRKDTGEISMVPSPQGKAGSFPSLSSEDTGTYSQKGNFLPDTLTKKQIKKKKKKSAPSAGAFDQETIQQRMEHIRQLKAMEKDIDIASYRQLLNGRASQDYQLNEWLTLINPNVYFCIDFENDVFTNTDRYYTNGICFNLVNPEFNRSFLAKLMIPLGKPVRNYYGISLVHRIYTPKYPNIDTLAQGERPFCSYLYLGFFKGSNSLDKRYRQLSALNVGLIGSAALGQQIMEMVHFKEMNGWKYQVKNDVIIDYQFRTEAGVIKGKSFEIGAMADARAGTLYDKIGIGPYLIAGIYDPGNLDNIALGTWSQTNPASGKMQCFIFYRFMSTLVGYDATLQGGVFTENEYALSSGQIKHFTFEHNLGLVIAYRWAAFHAEYFWLSPEYEDCESHQWMRYNLTFTF